MSDVNLDPSLMSRITQGMKNTLYFGQAMNTANYGMSSIIGNLMGQQMPDPSEDFAAQSRQSVRDAAAASGNPWAQMGAVVDGVVEATGGYTNTSHLGTGADVGNAMAARLMPGLGYVLKSGPKYQMSEDLKSMAGGYSGSISNALKAQLNSGKKLLFGRSTQKKLINKANSIDQSVLGIKSFADDVALSASAMGGRNAYNNAQDLNGRNYMLHAAKSGGKIEKDEDWFDLMFSEYDPQKFLNGGTMNVIPSGALHARRHEISEVNNITKKGIPVIDSDGKQLAEIERDEIIFRLEVTKELESLAEKYKNGDEDAAITAGRLLTKEILHNTLDNTNLIKKTK